MTLSISTLYYIGVYIMFKVGDTVKYIRKTRASLPCNSVGTIVSIDEEDGIPYKVSFPCGTRWCMDSSIVKTPSKNQQLLFSFME